MNLANYYQVYGAVLKTNLPLPIILPTDNQKHDIEVNIANCQLKDLFPISKDSPPEILSLLINWNKQQIGNSDYYTFYVRSIQGHLDVKITPDGKNIDIKFSDLELSEVTAILLGTILGTALRLQNQICLHSSVIKIDNHAIAIIGEKGAGKSTTAAAFVKAGFSILADDVAVVKIDNYQPNVNVLVFPGYPKLRLWKSAINGLFKDDYKLQNKVFQALNKYFLELSDENEAINHDSGKFYNQPLPLKAIYLLDKRQNQSSELLPRIEHIAPHLALGNLMIHRYPQTLQVEKHLQIQEFKKIGNLVKHIPVKHLHRKDDLQDLEQICNLIIKDS
jgi:hypothetical protein